MAELEPVIISPTYLWNELHVVEGASSEAAALALQQLRRLQELDRNNPEVAEQVGEYARITLVAGLSAARKIAVEEKNDISRVLTIVQDILSVFQEFYPFSQTRAEAKQRGNQWDHVYGAEFAQFICLRDSLSLFRFLVTIMPSRELDTFIVGLEFTLIELMQAHALERFSLIARVEESDYFTATKSYDQYLKNFGAGSATAAESDQRVSVASIMLGRAIEKMDFNEVLDCLAEIGGLVFENPQLSLFALKALARNASSSLRKESLAKRAEKIRLGIPDFPQRQQNLQTKISAATKRIFMGVGQNRVVDLMATHE